MKLIRYLLSNMDITKIINETLVDEAKKIITESEGQVIVYHIHCDGEPVDSFDNEDDAMQNLDIYKGEHPNKSFTIEKRDYNSYLDMIDQLDDLGETKELKETKKMGKKTVKVKTLGQAILDAKERNLEEIILNGETYNVAECWKQLEEEELSGSQKELDKNDNGKIDADDFAILRGEKNEEEDGEQMVCGECGMTEDLCECGTAMNENTKKTLRLTESELIELISKMVSESVPGIEVTKKAQSGSEKENNENLKDVEQKLKDYASFDGNDNPEFPNQEGQGEEKQARQNSEEDDEFVADNRGGGLEDLDYDNEPSEMFRERLKMALSGDSKMGNSQDYANVVKSDLGDKIAKKVERKKKAEAEAPMYNKDSQPINESLQSELLKIKNLSEYNKSTQ